MPRPTQPHPTLSRASGPARVPLARAITLFTATLLAAGSLAGSHVVLGAEPARVVSRGPTTTKTIALTFDDGWNPGRCIEIYDTLMTYSVPATWFPNAVYVRSAPKVWRRIAASFPMANHTARHRSLPGLSSGDIRSELRANERVIEAVTGRPMSKILRPPYGSYDARVLRVVGALGYRTVVLWDVSSADTSRRGTDRGVARAALRGGAGSIILMHCGPEVTPRILPTVIAHYACAGFRFATVEALLAGEPGESAQVSCPPPPLNALGRAGGRGRSGSPSSQRAALELLGGREWWLTDVAETETLAPAPPGVMLTLRFGSRQASGVVDCDTFAVPFTAGSDGSLSFGDLSRSTDGCAEADGPGPSEPYLGELAGSVGYRVETETLDLLDADGRERLRFRAAGRVGPPGDWKVAALVDQGGTLAEPGVDIRLSVVFGPTGTLRGSTGCNTYVGGYSTRREALSAGPLLVGSLSCGDESDALQARFLAALRSVARWELRDDTLVLRDAGDRVVLELLANVSGG